MHKKVKITVLRTEYYQELAEQYAIPNLGMCPFHQKGQVLYSDGINPPDGMCGVAWQVIAPMARQLSLGELVQPSGTWLNNDSICVLACRLSFCWKRKNKKLHCIWQERHSIWPDNKYRKGV